MTQHWTVDGYKELHHLGKLFQLSHMAHLHQSMITSFCLKVKANKDWTSQTILQVVEAVSNSDLPEVVQNEITQAFNQFGLTEATALQVAMSGQQIQNFSRYLSNEDWKSLEAFPANIVHTMSVCAKRLRTMEVTSLKESIKKEAMAVIFYCSHQLAQQPHFSAVTKKKMLQDFQGIFASIPKGQVATFQNYPSNPADLGQDWLSKV